MVRLNSVDNSCGGADGVGEGVCVDTGLLPSLSTSAALGVCVASGDAEGNAVSDGTAVTAGAGSTVGAGVGVAANALIPLISIEAASNTTESFFINSPPCCSDEIIISYCDIKVNKSI